MALGYKSSIKITEVYRENAKPKRSNLMEGNKRDGFNKLGWKEKKNEEKEEDFP